MDNIRSRETLIRCSFAHQYGSTTSVAELLPAATAARTSGVRRVCCPARRKPLSSIGVSSTALQSGGIAGGVGAAVFVVVIIDVFQDAGILVEHEQCGDIDGSQHEESDARRPCAAEAVAAEVAEEQQP